jgi:hypothetical protein
MHGPPDSFMWVAIQPKIDRVLENWSRARLGLGGYEVRMPPHDLARVRSFLLTIFTLLAVLVTLGLVVLGSLVH